MQKSHFSTMLLVVLSACYARADDPTGSRVDALTQQILPRVIEWRRDIHAHPELSRAEERTARLVAEQLKALGVDDVRTNVGGHGVVALIHGKKIPPDAGKPCVALRGDMDALPVNENTGLPFASKNPGVMHACGHDAHTAMLLGAAAVLTQLRGEFAGTVKLLFQPAEEGGGGAEAMIKDGALENPRPDAIFGLHVDPQMDVGNIGTRAGGLMAAVDRFALTIRGKQSHAAMPWQGMDPIVAAAHVITAIHTIPSHHVDARHPVVVSVGIVRAGTAWNIIPGEVLLEGTIRTLDTDAREKVLDHFQRLVTSTAAAHGTAAQIRMSGLHPAVLNDAQLVKQIKPSLMRATGPGKAIEVFPIMGGEDFALYQQKIPGVFCFLGVRNESIGAVHPLHTPEMRIDEAALPIGVRAHVWLALDFLNASK